MTANGYQADEFNWAQNNINNAQNRTDELTKASNEKKLLKEKGISDREIDAMSPDDRAREANQILRDKENKMLVDSKKFTQDEIKNMTQAEREIQLDRIEGVASIDNLTVDTINNAAMILAGSVVGLAGYAFAGRANRAPSPDRSQAIAPEAVARRREDEEGDGIEPGILSQLGDWIQDKIGRVGNVIGNTYNSVLESTKWVTGGIDKEWGSLLNNILGNSDEISAKDKFKKEFIENYKKNDKEGDINFLKAETVADASTAGPSIYLKKGTGNFVEMGNLFEGLKNVFRIDNKESSTDTTKKRDVIESGDQSVTPEGKLIPNSENDTTASISPEDMDVIKPKILKEIEAEFIKSNKHKKDSDFLDELKKKKETLENNKLTGASLTKADEKKIIALNKAIEKLDRDIKKASDKVEKNKKYLKDYLVTAEKVIDRSTTNEGLNDLETVTDPIAGRQVLDGNGTALQLRVAFEKIRMMGKENFTLNQEGQLGSKKQDLHTKKTIVKELKNMNSSEENNTKTPENIANKVERNQKIKTLDSEIQTLEKEVKALEPKVDHLKTIFAPVKELVFSNISTEKLSNFTAKHTCKLYTDYMQRILFSNENRGYAQNYYDRLRNGDVAMGKTHLYPVLGQGSPEFSGYTESEVSKDASYNNPKAKPLASYKINNILNSRPSFVQVHYDTDPTTKPGPNHFFMARVDYKEDGTYKLVSYDHNLSVQRGKELEMKHIYGVYK